MARLMHAAADAAACIEEFKLSFRIFLGSVFISHPISVNQLQLHVCYPSNKLLSR